MPALSAAPKRIGWLLFGAIAAVAVVFLFWLARGLAYDGDSFNWLALSGTSPTKALIEPYGGHLIFLPLLIFKAIIAVAGTSYTAFSVVHISLLITLAALLYVYGTRRVGPLLALLAPIALLFLGSSWNVLTQPLIGIQFLSALVPGTAALLALERDDRRGDVAGCALLTLATLGFELGLAFAVGAGVGIALRGDRWRRAWIVAVPALTYLVWKAWASQYPSEGLHVANLLWLPAYAVDSLGVISVSLFGLFFLVGGGQLTALKLFGWDLSRFGEGFVLFVFEALALLAIVQRLRRRGPIPASFWVPVAMLITVWTEQCLALAADRTPGEIRYILPDTVFFLLFGLEAARGVRATRTALLGAAAIAAVVVVGNLPRFQEGRDILAEYSPFTNATLTVIQLGGSHIPANFNPTEEAAAAYPPNRGPFLSARPVQKIMAELGSPGYSPSELTEQPEAIRRSADIVAVDALGLHPAPTGATCNARPVAAASFAVPAGGAIVVPARSSPLLARRFGGEFAAELGTVTGGGAAVVRIPGDGFELPWRLAAPEAGTVRVCPI